MLKYLVAFAFVFALTATGEADQPKPVVYVNHVLVRPDETTLAAVRKSAFLRDQFAPMEERTTVRTDTTYHGVYFYGTNTYFELMQPDKENGVGTSGIGFSIDRAAELPDLESGVAKLSSKPTTIEPTTRKAENGKQVPWFSDLEVPLVAADRLELFIMAYDPRFLAQWYPQFPPSTHATTRSAILDRYVAKIGKEKARANGLMEDVSSIELSGPALTNVCNALGATTASASSCTMNGVKLMFSGGSESRVCAVHFRLKRDAESQTLVLGASRLRLAGREATWTFCKD